MAVLHLMLTAFLASQSAVLARMVMEPMQSSTHVTATQDTCKDCTQIVELFVDMLSNADAQERVQNTLDKLCKRLPGVEAQNICYTQVKQYLPLAINILSKFIKPGEVCMVLGLCGSQSEGKEEELLASHFADMSNVVPGTDPEVQVTPQCTFCIFLMKKLESMLPKERTEDAIVKLLDEICGLLPASYKDECEDFINQYGKEVIEFLLSTAAPHTICTLLHLCLIQELPFVETPLSSECDSCQTLAMLSWLHLGSNVTEREASSFLESVCQLHPLAVPKCEVFTQRHRPRLQRVVEKQGRALDICGAEGLCVVAKEAKTLGGNRCTWGPEYVCRNMKSAQECNTVPYCQEHVWH